MKYFFSFVLLLALVSCKRNSDEITTDYAYYPLEVGRWYIYDVDVTRYNGSPIGIDSSYQLKEEIVNPITVEDETRYQLYRYYRSDASQEWDDQPDSVWTVFRRGNQLVKVENNVRHVKLSFPLEVGKTWDGNSMNTEDAEMYEMADVKRAFTITGGKTYTPTVTVIHSNESDIIQKDVRKEVFAENIGLIYRFSEIYRYDQDDLSIKIIDVGTVYEQRLVSYGSN
jgi:hypothetical protein